MAHGIGELPNLFEGPSLYLCLTIAKPDSGAPAVGDHGDGNTRFTKEVKAGIVGETLGTRIGFPTRRRELPEPADGGATQEFLLCTANEVSICNVSGTSARPAQFTCGR